MEAKWYFFGDNFLPVGTPFPLKAKVVNSFYEVLRIYNSVPVFFEDHVQRFFNSCQLKGVVVPYNSKYIHSLIIKLIRQNQINVGNIKFEYLICEDYNYLTIKFIPHSYPSLVEYSEGVHLCSFEIDRPDPHVKQSAVNDSIREKISQKLAENKAYEVLLVNHEGFITEGSRSNIFFIKGEELISPPTALILEGITRKKVLDLANRLSVNYTEKNISLAMLENIDAVFLTGTSPKILPVKSINTIRFTVENHITDLLIKTYNTLMDDYCMFAALDNTGKE